MSLISVRIAAGVLALLALAVAGYNWHAVRVRLRAYFLEPSPPEQLALVRIALFATLAWVALTTKAVWWASQPAGLRVLPYGWAWTASWLPIDAGTAKLAQALVVGGSALTVLGLLTRIAAPLAALAAVYLLATPSFFGKILHVDHALVMMALVIAASPCGDAWSLDARWKRSRGQDAPVASLTYTLPMRLCWLLLGTVYLFPGLYKIWDNGDLWLNGQRLLWELYDEWGHRKGFVPPFRLDEYPLLLKLLGTATLVFEVGFFFAVFHPVTRAVAAVSAFAFHFGVKAFLGIKFYAFLPLVMLIDLPLLRTLLTAKSGATQQDDVPSLGTLTALSGRALLPAALVGGALFLGQVGVAVARIETWPVALHPVFGERSGPGKIVHDHKIALEPQQGRERDLVYVLSKRGGGNGFKRTMLRFDRDVSKGIPRQKTSREIVQMLRDNGLEIVTGDHIAIYKTSRSIFPTDERTDKQQVLLRRYRVAEDGGLERVKMPSSKKKS